ncbi:RimK/LysX family protein, partial [Akkermansiaceae bacterium]|nr:RimK/LysX family protein [Akkermansiaceae bacterium]
GHEEKRPFIRTTLQVGSQQWEIEVSLANRESMKFRMLLGRTGMRNRISIDCGQSYLTQKKPKNISS